MHCRILSSILLSLLMGGTSRAETVTVVPTGDGDGLIQAARVAQAVVKRLNLKQHQARLGYIAPTPTTPPPDTTLAETLLENAFKSFETLDFAAVKSSARRALSIFKKAVKAGGGGEGYLRTLHLLAASAVFDGDNAAAYKAMNDAVIFSTAAPDKKRFNPTVQALYKRVLTEKKTGSVEASSTPEALIFFNRELKGVASGLIELRAGLYLVEVYRPGFLARRRWFRVRPGETRKLDAALKGAPGGETAMMRALHKMGSAESPDASLTSAMAQLRAKDLMIISAQGSCSADRCKLSMRRARGATFTDRREVTLGGGLDAAVKALTEEKANDGPTNPLLAGARACTLSTDCGVNERCVDGRCQRPTSITRKWWFWTAVGAVAAGAAVAIILPLSRPDGPVIEVK